MSLTEAQLREINDRRRRAGRKALSMSEAKRASESRNSSDSGLSVTDFLVGHLTGVGYNTSSILGSLTHKSDDSGSSSRGSYDSGRSYESDRSSNESSGGYSSGGDSGGSSGGDSGGGSGD